MGRSGISREGTGRGRLEASAGMGPEAAASSAPRLLNSQEFNLGLRVSGLGLRA